jgi:multiple sugar transport system ATP-binding protein
MAKVCLRNVGKYYGTTEVVRALDLEIAHNEFVALVGPSGCGKSTTLRMIAGLEGISDGEVLIDDRVVNELAPKDRDVAMVFQDYALYPHMSVAENMSFGLSVRKIAKSEIAARVQEAARVLNIEDLLDRKPKQLSGGQRQRVAMGRAIVRKPKVFLFDEPLSNLDAKLRVQMRTEIKRLHQRVATTIVYVTHDQVEAMTLADRVVVLRSGRIEQIGTPDEVYNRPVSTFVAGFIGSPAMNFVRGRVSSGGSTLTLEGDPAATALPIAGEATHGYAALEGRDVIVGIRAEHFSTSGPHQTQLVVTSDVIEPLGSDTLVYFKLGDADMVARVPPATLTAPGRPLVINVDVARIHLFDPETGIRHLAGQRRLPLTESERTAITTNR